MKKRFLLLISTILDEYRFMFVEQRAVLLILLSLPLFYPFVISSLYHQKTVTERPAILIDHDNSKLSRMFSIQLDATQDVKVVERIDSVEEGWEKIKSQQAEMMIYIPADFSSKIKQRKSSDVKMWVNSSNVLTYSVSYSGVSSVVQDMNAKIGYKFFLSQGMGSEAAKNRVFPIDEIDRFLFHPSISYGEFLVLGIFMIVMQQIILISLSFSLGFRREGGKLSLHKYFPFTVIEGRILAHFLFYILGVLVVTYLVIPIFAWPIRNPSSVVLIFILFLLAMAPISIAIAVFMKDRYEAFQLLMFASTPLFMICGYAWPFEQMPRYIQAFASIFPVTPAIQAFRILSMKTDDLSYITPYLGWMAVQFVVYLLIAVFLVRWVWYSYLKEKSLAKKSKET